MNEEEYVTIPLDFTEEEVAILKEIADAKGITLSEFARQAFEEELDVSIDDLVIEEVPVDKE